MAEGTHGSEEAKEAKEEQISERTEDILSPGGSKLGDDEKVKETAPEGDATTGAKSPTAPAPEKPKLTKEGAMLKARELQKRLQEERIEREKKEEIDRERARIESTKMALEQQRRLEEEEKKRLLYTLQREKAEHQKEKERQRELLKREWEERFGMPYDEAKEEGKKVKKMSGKEHIIHWCTKLKKTYKDSDPEGLKKCLTLIRTYGNNAAQNPTEKKYQRIKKANATFEAKVAPFEGAIDLLQCVGFTDTGDFLEITSFPDGFLLGQLTKFVDVILGSLP